MSETRADAPFVRRFWAYLAERFPPLGYTLLIACYVSSNQFLAQALVHPGQAVHYSPASLMAALAVLAFFFHLRVFDDHKDAAKDLHFFPDRILSRGLVTLRHLRIAGGLAIALELALGVWRGPAALAAVLIALAFSLLMLKEFFVGQWLNRHFLVYAATHMLIMPLLALVVFSFITGLYPWQAPGWFWLYGFVGVFVTFNWEISRKIRAPEDEVAGLDSYSRIFGTYGAAYLVILVRVVDTLMVSLVGLHLGLSAWFYAALLALFLVSLAGLVHFRLRTNRSTARRMESYAGIYIIAFDFILAVEIARAYPFQWF
jgi:4-hydroxybenzoate polyprenyltransferase